MYLNSRGVLGDSVCTHGLRSIGIEGNVGIIRPFVQSGGTWGPKVVRLGTGFILVLLIVDGSSRETSSPGSRNCIDAAESQDSIIGKHWGLQWKMSLSVCPWNPSLWHLHKY